MRRDDRRSAGALLGFCFMMAQRQQGSGPRADTRFSWFFRAVAGAFVQKLDHCVQILDAPDAIDHEQQMIFETWQREVGARELAKYWRRMLVDAEVLAIRRTLVDLRQAEIVFTGDELANMVTSIAVTMLAGTTWKTALLVEKNTQFGVSRRYQVFAETFSRDAIFQDREAALRWLLG
jgi:hypothetical protein